MKWEDIVKQEDPMREKRISAVKGLNAVRDVLESLHESLEGFMRDSDEEDGPYDEAQDMQYDIQSITEDISLLRGKMQRLFKQYQRLVREQEYIGKNSE